MTVALVTVLFFAAPAPPPSLISRAAPPLIESELIFPPESLHNHASCIVECGNGDLLVCWYNGSGERSADDVKVEGARKRRGQNQWSQRFVMADTPGFPDTNPCMVIDPEGRLWLFWQTIIANQWHTALPRYKRSSSYDRDGPPTWDFSDNLLFKPQPTFAQIVIRECEAQEAHLKGSLDPRSQRFLAYLAEEKKRATDKYFSRMGWMTRSHPLIVDGKRLIVPLYSDGYNFSIMAVSDDWGATWTASDPLVGAGNVQPSLVTKKDGTLVAYMRDNGPPPKRLMRSESHDRGQTWSPVTDTDIPNPGSGAEVVALKNGHWVLIYNDTERGRHSLAVSLSEDEGKTWSWTRHLEHNDPGPDATHAAYPSLVQARDGTLHCSYTYTLNGKNVINDPQGRPRRECIKHVRFNEEWVRSR
jgi:predicted neuraminidase